MDPDVARQKIIDAANLVLYLDGQSDRESLPSAAVALAEAAHDLDEWLRSGGFLPDLWLVLPGSGQQGRKSDVESSWGDGITSRIEVSPEVNEDRPRRDGGVCGHDVYSGAHDQIVPCLLDRGHEGEHVPV